VKQEFVLQQAQDKVTTLQEGALLFGITIAKIAMFHLHLDSTTFRFAKS
jgi:hypothetical protein